MAPVRPILAGVALVASACAHSGDAADPLKTHVVEQRATEDDCTNSAALAQLSNQQAIADVVFKRTRTGRVGVVTLAPDINVTLGGDCSGISGAEDHLRSTAADAMTGMVDRVVNALRGFGYEVVRGSPAGASVTTASSSQVAVAEGSASGVPVVLVVAPRARVVMHSGGTACYPNADYGLRFELYSVGNGQSLYEHDLRISDYLYDWEARAVAKPRIFRSARTAFSPYVIARCWASTGRADKALSVFRRLRQADPDDTEVARQLGWILVGAGRHGAELTAAGELLLAREPD